MTIRNCRKPSQVRNYCHYWYPWPLLFSHTRSHRQYYCHCLFASRRNYHLESTLHHPTAKLLPVYSSLSPGKHQPDLLSNLISPSFLCFPPLWSSSLVRIKIPILSIILFYFALFYLFYPTSSNFVSQT